MQTIGVIAQTLLMLQLAGAAISLPGCPETCGNISIPYPFGTAPSCFRAGFNLTCNNSSRLFLGDGSIEVLDISLLGGQVRINSYKLTIFNSTQLDKASWTGLMDDGPYTLSETRNMFTAIGCGILAQVVDPGSGEFICICASVCRSQDSLFGAGGSCSGISCCQTSIPMGIRNFNVELQSLNQTPYWAQGLQSKAFVVEKDQFQFSPVDLSSNAHVWESRVIPATLDWTIDSDSCEDAQNGSSFACRSENSECYDSDSGAGYRCNCSQGFQGNPYLVGGCQDIDECKNPEVYPCYGTCVNALGTYQCFCPQGTHGNAGANACLPNKGGSSALRGVLTGIGIGLGLLLLVLFMALLSGMLKARRAKKMKDKFFRQNKGLLLQQLISSSKDVAKKMKIFTYKELEKATDNFDRSRILGRGGHGTVYKGILSDQRVVAIKKSKIIVQREIDQFINEVAILSQINHRNVVKLFGCCLETEVPLLVYEFVSNGTLSQHLHSRDGAYLSWDDRLRIAVETARALDYLHTAASVSVFHRDVKSANILLDDGLTAKVSDFGASRSVPLNQTHITTAIQGTFGYLDPEYFHTSQLTEKSDVYSFGVILVELLTGQKPVSRSTLREGRNLATHFIWAMGENRLGEVLEARVVEEGGEVEIQSVATLAELCLRLRGEERPTIKEVEVRLEALRGSRKQLQHNWNAPKMEFLPGMPVSEGRSSGTTRQYSLEKEFMESTNYPR